MNSLSCIKGLKGKCNMKAKWNEMTRAEKSLYVFNIIFCTIAAVFAVLDISIDWKYAHFGWSLFFALFLFCEARMNWNKSRKVAILDLVLGILLVGFNVVTMIL